MSKKIKRYYAIKYFTSDLKGPALNYQYTGPRGAVVGPWHTIKNKKSIKCCGNGFHAALLEGIFNYYDDYITEDARCFVVELDGKISYWSDKIAAEKIRLVKEINLSCICDDDYKHVEEIAKEYHCLSHHDLCCILWSNKSPICNLTYVH